MQTLEIEMAPFASDKNTLLPQLATKMVLQVWSVAALFLPVAETTG